MKRTEDPLLYLDTHARVLANAALSHGLSASLERRRDGFWWLQLRINDRSYLYRAGVLCRAITGPGPTQVNHVNGVANDIAADKSRTIDMLAAAGISVPGGRSFDRAATAEALRYAMELGPPVCVKPVFGAKGESVFPNLGSPDWIEKALASVAGSYPHLRVEKHVGENEVRYFYVEPDIVGVMIVETLRAVGNGRSTVQQLMDRINAERRRLNLSSHAPIDWDEDRLELLAAQNMTPDAVPAAGRRVQFSRTGNRNRGGIGRDGRGKVHSSYGAIAKTAFQALPGLAIGAIDMRVRSLTIPAASDNYWVLEINGSPGLTGYHSMLDGVQDVASPILRWLIADAAAER